MSTVWVAGGGTGGHLFPGLAVASELRARGIDVRWLGARRGLEAVRIPPTGIPLTLLPVTGAVGRSAGARVSAAVGMVPATLSATVVLLRSQAHAVLAVGGYAALPGALAAGVLGLPLVLQEQNAVAGLANRFLAPWSVAIACGFEAALAAFPSLPATVTGNPVRTEFFTVPPPPTDPLTLLVIGGSQGSAFLNTVLPEALAALATRQRLPHVLHQAGPRWEDAVRQRYASLGLVAEVVGFFERPAEALARSALVVARSGASSVSELAAARRAAVLVPFAQAAHGHQLANARALAATGAAEVLEEHEAKPEALAAAIARLLADPDALVQRGTRGAALSHPEAARSVAELIVSRLVDVPSPTHHGVAAKEAS